MRDEFGGHGRRGGVTAASPPNHFTADDLEWEGDEGDVQLATLNLREGESAWAPTTCRDIWGPAEVNYRRWPDGGIDAFVSYLPPDVDPGGRNDV